MREKRKTKGRGVCVVIPAYNEATTIGSVVRDVKSTFKKGGYFVDIIVINDGSRDSTEECAIANGAYVINHILNSGAGSATATGLSYADQNNFDIAVTMDADGQHSAADALKGVNLINTNGVDLLIGSRLINSLGMSKVKVLGNKGLSLITYLLFGINATDSQSGLRIFSQRALKDLRWRTSGYEFCSEMLWRAKQQGLRISEYPIKAIYTDYSRSKGQSNWNAFNIVRSLLKRRVLEMFSE
ncbi:glycosyltransferase family 2 protein [Candidatus Saccharibacteria bacterium]|nr:glycosyltransferase family 2 protein [Candidatus Saccharibacteria bacterium]